MEGGEVTAQYPGCPVPLKGEPWVWVDFTCQICGYVEHYPLWFSDPIFDEAFVCWKCRMKDVRKLGRGSDDIDDSAAWRTRGREEKS